MRGLKWLGVLGAAILLSLGARMAISAVDGIDVDSGARSLTAAVEDLFSGWRGSKPMIAFAVLCIILAVAGKGIERR